MSLYYKKGILFFALLIISVASLSGQTFENFYRTPSDDIVYDAVLADPSIAIFCINSGDFILNSYTSKFFKIDIQTGNYLDSLAIDPNTQDLTFKGIFDLLKVNDTLFIGIGKCQKSGQIDEVQYIIHLNNNLEFIFDTLVDIGGVKEKFQKSILSSDNRLVSIGLEIDSVWNKLLCEKTIYGELIGYQKYNHPTSLTATAIVDIPQKNKYHLFVYGGIQHSFDIIDKTTLAIDTIIEYPVQFLPIDAICDPNDTSIYYIAGKQGGAIPSKFDLSYLKITSDGVVEQLIYPTDENIFYTYKCLSVDDGHLYFGGVYPFTQSPPTLYPEERWILLYKLFNDGSIIWQKFYKGDVNYMPYKVLATNDGGALIFSTKYDWNDPIPNQRDVHILKIDSTGYYTPITGIEEGKEQLDKQILVYPNPAVDKINFIFGLYSNLEINIFNIQGEKVFSNTFVHSAIIDISGFEPGIYPYVISGKKGFYEEGKLVKE